MKKQIQISIPKTCSEQWNNFKPVGNGGFCESCNKVVLDFTQMRDDEIQSFFENSAGKVCGRFRNSQLKVYQQETPSGVFFRSRLLKAGLVSSLIALTCKPMFAQNIDVANEKVEVTQANQYSAAKPFKDKMFYTIKGMVIDEFGNSLPGVNVILIGSGVGTVTDIDGKFIFPQPLNVGDRLVFTFIGLISKEFIIKHDMNETIEITMEMDEYDMTGEVSVNKLYTRENAASRFWHKIKSIF